MAEPNYLNGLMLLKRRETDKGKGVSRRMVFGKKWNDQSQRYDKVNQTLFMDGFSAYAR